MTQEVSNYLVDFQAAIDKAILEGFTVVRGDSRTLLLDLDTPECIKHFDRMHGAMCSFIDFSIKDRWKSKSGIGEHVIITVNDRELSLVERIALQSALGSDRLHEYLSLVTGVWEGNEDPIILFRPPQLQISGGSEL